MADDNVSTKKEEDNGDAQLLKMAEQQAERLAEIARVEPRSRASFCEEVAGLIWGMQIDTINRSRYRAEALDKVERAVNALVNAVWGLNKVERDYLQEKIDKFLSDKEIKQGHPAYKLGNITIALAAACIGAVGKNPLRTGKRGNAREWDLQVFIYDIWRIAKKHGGDLNASKREGKYYGAMFRAVEVLRPSFPRSHLFRRGQGQTIVNIVTNAKRGIEPGD
jgi:hypothetical protein